MNFMYFFTFWILACCFSCAEAAGEEVHHSASVVNVREENVIPVALPELQSYEQNPDQWHNQDLLAIALAYAREKDFGKAIKPYKKYLETHPDSLRATRGLGNCYWLTGDYDAAFFQFKKGWGMGDDQSLLSLANSYSALSRFQDIKPLIPDLLKLQKKLDDADDKHEITFVLTAYSLKARPTHDKEVFLKATKGLNNEFILEREDTAQIVILGLKEFGYQDRANQLEAKLENQNGIHASAQYTIGSLRENGHLISIFMHFVPPNTNISYISQFELEKYDAAKYFEPTNSFCGFIELKNFEGGKIPLLKPGVNSQIAYPDSYSLKQARIDLNKGISMGPELPMSITGTDVRICVFNLPDTFKIEKPGDYQLTIWPKIYKRSETNRDLCVRIDLPRVTIPIHWTGNSTN